MATTTASFLGAAALPFVAQSAAVSRNAAVIGVRAVLETNSPLAVYASHTGALRGSGSGSAQAFAAGLRFAW